MTKPSILIFLIEHNPYIVGVEIYIQQEYKMQLLEKIELMEVNFKEMSDKIIAKMADYKANLLLVPLQEYYNNMQFSNIRKINLPKNIKNIVKNKSIESHIVHPLMSTINNEHDKWNGSIVEARLESLTTKLLDYLLSKKCYIRECYLMSVVNFELVQNIKNLALNTSLPDKIKVEIVASQICSYLHVIIFINDEMRYIYRFTLKKIENNQQEIKLIIEKLLAEKIYTDDSKTEEYHNVFYLFLSSTLDIASHPIKQKTGAFKTIFSKEFKASNNNHDLTKIMINSITKFSVNSVKIIPLDNLVRLLFANRWIIRLMLTIITILLSINIYILSEIYLYEQDNKKLEYDLMIKNQSLQEKGDDFRDKLNQTNESIKKIYYNILQNRQPINLIASLKRANQYNLKVNKIHYYTYNGTLHSQLQQGCVTFSIFFWGHKIKNFSRSVI